MATFKLLLTGVDDSAIQPIERERTETLSRTAKAEVIDELLIEQKSRLADLVGEEDDALELNSQLARLDETLAREQAALRATEQAHREVIGRRTNLRRTVEVAEERRAEIDELQARFALLDQHYLSDLARLDGIREAGSLLGALTSQVCPLCGADPESQRHAADCDGNIEVVVQAADAESSKITTLRNELRETVSQLRGEAARFDDMTPSLFRDLNAVQLQLDEMNPSVAEQRAAYSEVLEKRSAVQSALNIIAAIAELEKRKASIETTPAKVEEKEGVSSDLSASTLDDFSLQLEEILKAWNFPDASRVYFDKQSRDFVISGKPRGSRGKGMRAITYAAFTIALIEYTQANERPHPGFAVLDTPLLAYREPEGDEDDLSGTDVLERFYNYLVSKAERQVIILENVDPPEDIKKRSQSIFFSKNPHLGRYGFFPMNATRN
jgi:hypothetical protein